MSKSKLTPSQIDYITNLVEKYGIEHVFLFKHTFDEIEDVTFHEKRKEFIRAYNEFEVYLRDLSMQNSIL